MGRPGKLTMDFFVHDADASGDRKIRLLSKKHGNDGYATYFRLLEALCHEPGMILSLASPDCGELLAEDFHLRDVQHLYKIIQHCAEIGLIDRQIWESERSIFSQGLYKRYKGRLEDRKSAAQRQRRSREAKSLQNKIDNLDAVVTRDNPVTSELSQKCHSTEAEYRVTETDLKDLDKTNTREIEPKIASAIACEFVECELVEEEPAFPVVREATTGGDAALEPKKAGYAALTAKDFDRFWDATAMKQDKAKTRDLFLKIKNTPADVIIEAWQRQQEWHIRKNGHTQYLKRPLTWLRGKCWEDEIEPLAMTGLKPEEIARAAKLEADIRRMQEKYGDGFRGNEYTAATKNRRMQ